MTPLPPPLTFISFLPHFTPLPSSSPPLPLHNLPNLSHLSPILCRPVLCLVMGGGGVGKSPWKPLICENGSGAGLWGGLLWYAPTPNSN